MRRIASMFLMNAGCFYFGKQEWKKCPIVDENVRNMTQEAKSALAFTLFYTYGMGPEGDPSVAVKQMWFFLFSRKSVKKLYVGSEYAGKEEKLAQHRGQMHQYDPKTATLSACNFFRGRGGGFECQQ